LFSLFVSDIDHTLSYLDHVIGFYSICTDVESIIRSGPAGPRGLDTFLAAMTKLNQAQNYFQKNNPQSVELENVVSINTVQPMVYYFILFFGGV
jgi:hypothetical protein